MLSKEANERLTRVGPGTPMGDLLRRYWHPVATDDDLLISSQLFPLAEGVRQVDEIRQSMLAVTGGASSRFR